MLASLAKLLTGGYAKLIAIGAVVVVVFGSGVWVTHNVDLGSYNALKADYAQKAAIANAEALAEQQRLDTAAQDLSRKYETELAATTAQDQAQLREVQQHVQEARSRCITYGFVRVLDAAATGRVAADLHLPARGSDGDCAPVTALALARNIVGNYATSRANTAQLNALIGFYRAVARR